MCDRFQCPPPPLPLPRHVSSRTPSSEDKHLYVEHFHFSVYLDYLLFFYKQKVCDIPFKQRHLLDLKQCGCMDWTVTVKCWSADCHVLKVKMARHSACPGHCYHILGFCGRHACCGSNWAMKIIIMHCLKRQRGVSSVVARASLSKLPG